MTGSVIDGEDAVQDAMARAIEAFKGFEAYDNVEGWVFRIAHNAALDLVRRQARDRALFSGEENPEMVDPHSTTDERIVAASTLRTFMRLPVSQRSCVILMDVLGYSLDEIES